MCTCIIYLEKINSFSSEVRAKHSYLVEKVET